jgi:pimeloyl-ACP methyl ester carboxylesterase
MKVRTEDMNLTIDTILGYASKEDSVNVPPEQQDAAKKLYQSIDTDKIGVFGHSMGAAASVQIGRERNDVDAVINLDGPYFSEMTYDAALDEFVPLGKPYNLPILNIYSDQVWVQLKDGTSTGTYAGNKISSQIAEKSYNVYLKGTKHLTLTDLAIVSPFLTYMLNGEGSKVDARKCIELENSLILGFFDEVLKGKGTFTPKEVYTFD